MWYKKSLILAIAVLFLFVFAGLGFAQNNSNVTQAGDNNQVAIDQTGDNNDATIDQAGVIYRNPRVYNVDYSFELVPDPAKIDRDRDLKVWIPIPREWDSQKNVKIVSIEPEPQNKYTDPEYGNKIFYWNFGEYPESSSYVVTAKYRFESYEVHAMVDTAMVKPYDKTSELYKLYTKSGHIINITPKVRKLAQIAIGEERNPYLQAKRIHEFVRKKMRYKSHRLKRGSGTKCLLDFPVVDKKTGEEHYEGACGQYSALFIALCRSVGIPARSVYGRIGWVPFRNKGISKMFSKLDTVLTDDGFAGAQHHGMSPHMWAEFYLPDYGWIPAMTGEFGRLSNKKVIMSKGRDIHLGPNIPQKHHDGYGFQWVPIYEGRVDGLLSAVWNIGKIQSAISRVYHTLDPFPADALSDYSEKVFQKDNSNKKLAKFRKTILGKMDYYTRAIPNRDTEFSKMYSESIWTRSLQYEYDAFVCHMLRKVMGDEKFSQLSKEYEELRTNSSRPVETSRFIQMAGNIYGESLEWFFKQWEKTNGLPHLKLDGVTLKKEGNGWKIKGQLIQSGSSFFKMPVEFSLATEKGPELYTIWQKDRIADFEFQTANKPITLRVDPNNDILKLQTMPLQLSCFWDGYPNITLIYGTTSESEANRTAAERFNNEYLGLSSEIIKSDTSVTDKDLNTECVILFGRPVTNKISKRFKNNFKIKFNGDKFSYKGKNYVKSTEGAAQIINHPLRARGQLILYAGLSGSAMLQFCDLYFYDAPHSYIIYDGERNINSGDWEEDRDLFRKFEKYDDNNN